MSRRRHRQKQGGVRRPALPGRQGIRVPPTELVTRWVCYAAAGFLLAAFFLVPFLAGRTYVGDDLEYMHLPFRTYYDRQIAEGRIPIWCPNLFGGFPLLAEGQTGVLHPFHLLTHWLFSTLFAVNLEIFLSFAAALVGTVVFLRSLGLDGRAAVFGGIAFAFSGNMILRLVHVNVVAIVAHMPWMWWCARRYFGTHRARWLVYAALLLTSQLFLGHPQSVAVTALPVAAYCLIALWRDAGRATFPLWRMSVHIGLGLGAVLVALMLAAPQLLATAAYLPVSNRAVEPHEGFAGSLSLPPVYLATFLMPWLFRVQGSFWLGVGNFHEFGLYVGLSTLLFAVVGVVDQPHRRLVLVSLSGVVVMILFAFGQHVFLHRLLLQLPLFSSMRGSCRVLVVVDFLLIVLGAVGLDLMLRDPKRFWQACRIAMPTLALVIVLLCAAVVGVHLRARGQGVMPSPGAATSAEDLERMSARQAGTRPGRVSFWQPVILVSLVAAAAAVARRSVRHAAWSAAGFVILLAADIGLSSRGYHHTRPFEEWIEEERTPFMEAAVERVREGRAAGFHNFPLLFGGSAMDGYTGFHPADPARVFRLVAGHRQRCATILGLLGIRFLHAVPPHGVASDWHSWGMDFDAAEGLSRGLRTDRGDLYVVEPVLPRVLLARSTTATALPMLLKKEPAWDAGACPSVEGLAFDADDALPLGEAGIVRETPTLVEIRAKVPGRRVLVLNDLFYPEWQAEVDGVVAPILRANGWARAVVVEGGDHTVMFRFVPRSLVLGLYLAAAGVAVLALSALITALLRRRKGSTPQGRSS